MNMIASESQASLKYVFKGSCLIGNDQRMNTFSIPGLQCHLHVQWHEVVHSHALVVVCHPKDVVLERLKLDVHFEYLITLRAESAK